jgi:hypothetical protein
VSGSGGGSGQCKFEKGKWKLAVETGSRSVKGK